MKNKKPSTLLLTLLASSIVLSACNSSSNNGTTTSNNTPVASAGSTQTINVGTLVTLDASASSDADGDTLSYAWTLTSSPDGSNATLSSASAAQPTFTPNVAGSYAFSVTVNDGQEDATATVTITVNAAMPANTAPVANAGTDKSVIAGSSVSLDASASSDADGDTLSYAWTLTSSPGGSNATLSSASAAQPTFTPNVAGSYVFLVTVNDGQVSSSDSVTITASAVVAPENTAPVANAGTDKSVMAGDSVSLDASASSDADGDTLIYSWAVISVPTGSSTQLSSTTTVNPTFTADVAGTYTFEVTVDDATTTTTDQVTITASETATSTNGILCDFSQSIVNESASVNATSTATWSCTGTTRDLSANGLPDHAVGVFPNSDNPNTISAQTVDISYTITPTLTTTATVLGGPSGAPGYVLNGVKIDASTAGSCPDSATSTDACSAIDSSRGWNIEALGTDNPFDFGTDDNNAHVQPGGAYHYHGMPEGFITLQGGNSTKMTMIGWAADGYPIYARYGYTDANDATSAIKAMTGSYQTVSSVASSRPSTSIIPLGSFQQDWEYTAGSGDLDECNGRTGVTPEFPNGIYHYYATDTYPYFQRCVKGEVTTTGGTSGPSGPPPA